MRAWYSIGPTGRGDGEPDAVGEMVDGGSDLPAEEVGLLDGEEEGDAEGGDAEAELGEGEEGANGSTSLAFIASMAGEWFVTPRPEREVKCWVSRTLERAARRKKGVAGRGGVVVKVRVRRREGLAGRERRWVRVSAILRDQEMLGRGQVGEAE